MPAARAGDATLSGPEDYERIYRENLRLIEEIIAFVCRACRFSPEDAKDFSQDVHLKLIGNNYRVLRDCTGSSLRSYLKVVILRLSVDRRNREWGKHRPSAEAKRLGEVGRRIEQLLVREGMSLEEARQQLRINEKIDLTDEEFDDICERLPPRWRRQRLSTDELSLRPAPDANPWETLDGKLGAERRRAILAQLAACREQLPSQQQLLLKLHFEEDLKFSEIAQVLGTEQKPLYPEKERIFAALRKCFAAAGFEEGEIRTAFRLLYGPTGPDGPEEE